MILKPRINTNEKIPIWILSSMKKEDLIKLANDSLIEANKTYSELKEPNKIQISMKKKLDQLAGKN